MESPIKQKSYTFALRIIGLGKYLQAEKREYILSKQVVRSGTSIGANVEEASAGLSRRDFAARMGIASREARETAYWLKLLRDSGYIDIKMAESLLRHCNELVKILTAIVKSTQESE